VFLEHGGSGGKDAAPVARMIVERYQEDIEPIFDQRANLEYSANRRR